MSRLLTIYTQVECMHNKTVKQRLLDLGMKNEEINNHYSDLYVKATPISKQFVKNNYEWRENVTTFVSQIDGQMWYDIPFAYFYEYHKIDPNKEG